MDKKEFGKMGEEKAVSFLKEKGYKIIDRNYLKRTGEIDIIAFDPHYNEYVFVEVKTRKNSKYGYPEEYVDDDKIEKIVETGENWLTDNNIDESEWRIDIISIEWTGKEPKITHLENIS